MLQCYSREVKKIKSKNISFLSKSVTMLQKRDLTPENIEKQL